MTDPRRATLPAPTGLLSASALSRRPHAVVVGGGIAGLAAATGLAERGVTVDVVERESHLGGRVAGWDDELFDGTPVAMNRGFHAFFRQYYNLRKLLRRVDFDLGMFTPVADYPLVDAGGRYDSFKGLPRTPPLNALAFALRSPTFRPRDLARLDAHAAAPLATVSVPDVYRKLDDLDADTFLRDINFPDAARHLAFEVFSRSFFAEPANLSAAELVTMFHIYFLGSSEGLVFDVANANFDAALWNPLREYLEKRGVRFCTGISVKQIEVGSRFTVSGDTGDEYHADAVVLATDVAGLRTIVGGSPRLGAAEWRRRIESLGTAPPFVVQRIWLDRPVHPDRPAFLGTGGREPLDNVSILERYEREAADWSRRTGGSVVELHAYAVPSHRAGLPERLRARMHELYPETAQANVVGELILAAEDCPRFAPGDYAQRPPVVTPVDGLMLAGDGIRVDLPVALMERAATTGWFAANRLLRRFGLAGHVLQTVPNHGRSAPLRWLATRDKRSQR